MNKNKSLLLFNENTHDYWKTFFITLFIVAIFVVFNIFYMIHNVYKDASETNKQTSVDAVFESYLVGIMIDKNLEFSKNFPKNYAVNVRLGILYSYKKDYLSAEKQFKSAIEKAPSYDYVPSYQLAKLYVKTYRLQEAQDVMDKISDKPNKHLIKLKADIYALLGDAYYKDGYDALAVIKYEKSIYYYSLINNKELDNIKKRFMTACISLGDKYVEVGKIDEAILALEKAYKINPKNIMVNYKLGLLYEDNEPYKSYQYLSYVYKVAPQELNDSVYPDLLTKLANLEQENGNFTEAELYRKRIRQYEKFVYQNLIHENDIYIDVNKLDISNDIAAREYIMNTQFTLRNNTDKDIETLYIKVIFKNGDEIIQKYVQKLYDENSLFESGATTPAILISAADSYVKRKKEYVNKNFTVEIYVYKFPKYEVKLFSKEIKKPDIHK